MIYKVGTRGSALALAQTNNVIDILNKTYTMHHFEAVVIKTTGDKIQDKALDQIGSKGVFVDEIERQLLSGEIQMAVHSLKDMPEEPEQGLVFSKAWKREDPRDVLILKSAKSFSDLPQGAIIATGSKRREFQLKRLRNDIQVVGIRGNVDTRIRRLHEGLPDGTQIDGIVLAAAGLKRLGRDAEITEYLEPEDMIPAPGQGILALELRADNADLLEMLNALSDDDTQKAAELERGFLKSVGGDCHMPVGAYWDSDNKMFYTLTGNADGSVLTINKNNLK